jgi:hypothetical protein
VKGDPKIVATEKVPLSAFHLLTKLLIDCNTDAWPGTYSPVDGLAEQRAANILRKSGLFDDVDYDDSKLPKIITCHTVAQRRLSRVLRNVAEHPVPGNSAELPPEKCNPGTATYSTISLIAHSCVGNAWYFTVTTSGKAVVFATRAVRQGEEITVPLVEYKNDPDERRFYLTNVCAIKCACVACARGWGDLRDRKGIKKLTSELARAEERCAESKFLDPLDADALLQLRVRESLKRRKKMTDDESYVAWSTLFRHKIVGAMALKYSK